MSDKSTASDDDMINTSNMTANRKSSRFQIIKNLIYFISLFDFLIHYTLVIELGVFEQIYRLFEKVPQIHFSSIQLCQLPIKQYIPFNLSQLNFYIFYLSILTLILSIEAVRKSSLFLYRIYIMIKFLFIIALLVLCIINISANLTINFIHTPIILEHSHIHNSSDLINTDTCLTYAREKMAHYLLTIFNLFVFFMSMECSKLFPLFQRIDLNHHHRQEKLHRCASTLIKA